MTDIRTLLPVLTCALLLMTGCAEHAAPGAPVETRAGIPPVTSRFPLFPEAKGQPVPAGG